MQFHQDQGSRAAPGKRTLTEELPVQQQEAGGAPGKVTAATTSASAPEFSLADLLGLHHLAVESVGDDAGDDVESDVETAERGTSGSGSELPHLMAIRRAFGRHDVSGTHAYTGSDAAMAARSLGAAAYTRGEKVAFDGAPDLHTAAHEAAHVVQQRSKSIGVGEQGDAHEAHADQVADQVVRGQSAESLLDRYAPGAPSAPGLQRKLTYTGSKGRRTLNRKSNTRARDELFQFLELQDQKLKNHLNRLIDSPVSHTLSELGKLGVGLPPVGRHERSGLIKDDEDGRQRLDAWFRESVFMKQQTGLDKHLQLLDRLIADLEKLPPDQHHDLLAQQLPGVLLYLMHNSSHAPPPGLSKVQLHEYQSPLFYARSQDDHPHKDLLQEIVRMVIGKTGAEVLEFLLPCNDFMKEVIDQNVSGSMSLARDTNYVKTPQGLVRRPPQGVQKYDGTVVGNAGLRKNNAQTLTDSLSVLLQHGGKSPGKSKELQEHGLSEKKLDGTPALIQLLRLHYEMFGKVSSKVAEPSTLDQEITKLGEPEPRQVDGEKLQDNTLFGRNLAYRSSMAAAIARSVGSLGLISAVSSEGHPNLSIVIEQPPHTTNLYTPGQSSHAAFVNVALSYFGGLLNAIAANLSIDVCVTRRQSFGFLRPTLTDTGASFRLSLGMQPNDYAHVVISALHHLNHAIATLDSGTARRAFKIIEPQKDNGPGDRLCHFMSSETNQLKAFNKCQDSLPSFSAFIDWICTQDERDYQGQPNNTEGAHFQEGMTIVTYGKIGARIGQSLVTFEKIKTEDPALKLEPMRDSLEAVVAQAHETLWARRAHFDQILLPETLKWLLTRLINGIKKGRHLLANWRVGDVEEESRLFSKAAIVVEDLLEHLLALRSLPVSGTHDAPVQAEDRVKQLLCGIHQLGGELVHVYRADSGEQAGVASMLLTARLSLEDVEKLDWDSKIGIKQSKKKPYFEYPKAIKESGLMWNDEKKSKSIGEITDLSPYGGDMTDNQHDTDEKNSNEVPDVVFVDLTNADLFSTRVIDLVGSWKTHGLPQQKRLVLFASLLKHDELGLDKLQAGRVIVFGADLPGLLELNRSVRHPVVDDFLNMMLDINLYPTTK